MLFYIIMIIFSFAIFYSISVSISRYLVPRIYRLRHKKEREKALRGDYDE